MNAGRGGQDIEGIREAFVIKQGGDQDIFFCGITILKTDCIVAFQFPCDYFQALPVEGEDAFPPGADHRRVGEIGYPGPLGQRIILEQLARG